MEENAIGRPIMVSRGEVIGMGKVKVPRTDDFNYEIPILSFLVIEEASRGFVSSCMHLHIDGYGKQDTDAVDDMIENISSFLRSNFSKLSLGDAWLNLMDLSHIDDETIELWNAYRDVQFSLAARDIPTDSVESLKKRMAQMQQRIDWLEYENARLQKNPIPLRTIPFPSLVVDYTSLRGVA